MDTQQTCIQVIFQHSMSWFLCLKNAKYKVQRQQGTYTVSVRKVQQFIFTPGPSSGLIRPCLEAMIVCECNYTALSHRYTQTCTQIRTFFFCWQEPFSACFSQACYVIPDFDSARYCLMSNEKSTIMSGQQSRITWSTSTTRYCCCHFCCCVFFV